MATWFFRSYLKNISQPCYRSRIGVDKVCLKEFPKGGYHRKILRVDLSKMMLEEESISPEILYQFIGGTGLGIRLLYDEVKQGIDPYSPENRIIFTTGPLTGTLVPGSGTYTVVSINTLTGLATSAQANGCWGARLKYAGYDAVIVQGRSDHPVYLHVADGKAEIEDAARLKGKDTFETDRILRAKYGESGIDHRISVAAIGPAGENLVRFASISSDRGHTAATGGIGAIMGAKNLKAVVVHGSQKIPMDPLKIDSFIQHAKQWRQEAKQTGLGKMVNEKGTLGLLLPYHEKGWVPVRNLTTNEFQGAENFNADHIRQNIYKKIPRSCYACTFAHCHVVKVTKGAHKGFVGEEPEYEIMAGFGPNWGIGDPGAVTMLNNLNDSLGMDAKETSFLVSMMMEGYEKGLIAKEDLDGIDLKWGDVGAATALLKKISRRDGIGNILAEGVKRTAETLGGEFPNMAVFVKKGNAPHVHDPRTRWGTLFTQAISNTGSQEGIDMTARSSPELGFNRPTSDPDEYLAKVQARTGPKRQFEECLGFCYFQACSLKTMVETLNTVTGGGYDIDECLKVGKRGINLLRMFNKRQGMTKDDDTFSPRLGRAPVNGPGKGKSLMPAFEKVRDAYYREMRWDENGMPTRETLKMLDLAFTLSDLED
jgi:aldehyde:ferredoxin oxidoreductase